MRKFLQLAIVLATTLGFGQVDLELTGNINTPQYASNSITLTNGTLLPGAHLIIDPLLKCPITSQENYTYARSYDITGKLNGESISYHDDMGKEMQSMSRDMLTRKVWVTETFYDSQGRAAVTTLPVPDEVDNCMDLREDFTRNAVGNPYGVNDFSGGLDKLSIPDATSALGKYYGENHPDPYHDLVEYPLVRTVYDPNNDGAVLKTIGGNKKPDGSWKESFSYTLPAAQELYYLFGKEYWEGNHSELTPINLKSFKTVSRDADGREFVTFTDEEGKVLATAQSGPGGNRNFEVVKSFNQSGFLDIHLPLGYDASDIEFVNFEKPGRIKNLRTDEIVTKDEMEGGNIYRIFKTAALTKLYIDDAGQIVDLSGELSSGKSYEVKYERGFSFKELLENQNVVGYGVCTIKIYEDNRAYVYLKAGWAPSSKLKTGVIFRMSELPESLPTTDLGYIYDYNGMQTPYKAYIYHANTFYIEDTSGGDGKVLDNLALEYGDKPPSGSDAIAFVRYKVNYHHWSLNYYDKAGRPTSTVPPIGISNDLILDQGQPPHTQQTTLVYDALGQLVSTTSPDEGTSQFKYRRDGQIRFSQNSKQLEVSRFSYTDYDVSHRPIESGECQGNFATLNPDGSFTKSSCTERFYTLYDVKDPDLHTEILSAGMDPAAYQQTFTSGSVSKTSNASAITWYSYDHDGRVVWVVQKIVGLGLKTLDYEYDVLGRVQKLIFQKHIPSEYYEHLYAYDELHRLIEVRTSTDGESYRLQAEYTYNEEGELIRKEIGDGLQGIDYVYNASGMLKAINHPSLMAEKDPGGDGNDVFGLALDYYAGDYKREGNSLIKVNVGVDNFSGNIKALTWNTGNLIDPEVMDTYFFGYNDQNWLKYAYRSTNPKDTEVIQHFPYYAALPDYNIYGITYDVNGNILSLNRNKHMDPEVSGGSNAMDQLSYVYKQDKPNQLDHVDDAVTTETQADDIKDQNTGNYVYNNLGQLIEDKAQSLTYTYTVGGLVSEVRKNKVTLVKFYYNDRGHRVRKDTYYPDNGIFQASTFYVRDVAGVTLGIYTKPVGGDATLVEQSIYGSSRLGIHKRASGTDLYQLTDHLGNVRAVIAKNGENAVSLINSTDYYPFGMTMPGRSLTGDLYRYGYQGEYAEKDEETGLNAFELRMYDARIGRWATIDPYRQFFSPYIGMANNPIYYTDPDGGCVDADLNSIPCPDGIPEEGNEYTVILNEVFKFSTEVGKLKHQVSKMNPVTRVFYKLFFYKDALTYAKHLDFHNDNPETSHLYGMNQYLATNIGKKMAPGHQEPPMNPLLLFKSKRLTSSTNQTNGPVATSQKTKSLSSPKTLGNGRIVIYTDGIIKIKISNAYQTVHTGPDGGRYYISPTTGTQQYLKPADRALLDNE